METLLKCEKEEQKRLPIFSVSFTIGYEIEKQVLWTTKDIEQSWWDSNKIHFRLRCLVGKIRFLNSNFKNISLRAEFNWNTFLLLNKNVFLYHTFYCTDLIFWFKPLVSFAKKQKYKYKKKGFYQQVNKKCNILRKSFVLHIQEFFLLEYSCRHLETNPNETEIPIPLDLSCQ